MHGSYCAECGRPHKGGSILVVYSSPHFTERGAKMKGAAFQGHSRIGVLHFHIPTIQNCMWNLTLRFLYTLNNTVGHDRQRKL